MCLYQDLKTDRHAKPSNAVPHVCISSARVGYAVRNVVTCKFMRQVEVVRFGIVINELAGYSSPRSS